MTPPPVEPQLNHRTTTPPGNIPKGRMTALAIGMIVLLLTTILITGFPSTKPPKDIVAAAAPVTLTNADEAKRQQGEMQQSLKDIQEAQQRAEAAKHAFEAAEAGATAVPANFQQQPVVGPDGKLTYPTATAAPVPESAIEADKKARAYQSLFSPLMALSLRPASATRNAAPTQAMGPSDPEPEPLILPNPVAPAPPPPPAAKENQLHAEVKPDPNTHTLFEGTIIEAILTNRLEGSFSGPVNCIVTTPAYSHDGQTLLIPRGTRVLGEARRVTAQEEQRLAVVFHRLIMPDGYSVTLDKELALNPAGETGLADRVNNHYAQIFGTSIALGLLSGFSQFGTGSALTSNGISSYRQGVASSVSTNNSTILERQLNRLPSITVREGHRVKVYLSSDLQIPAYDKHPPVPGL